jgi:hypothetical protein
VVYGSLWFVTVVLDSVMEELVEVLDELQASSSDF